MSGLRTRATGVRSPLTSSLARALVAILIAGLALAAVQLAVITLDGPAGWLPALFPLVFVVYLVAGTIAWWRRPSNGMGALILLSGSALLLGGFGNSDIPVLNAVGAITATLVMATTIQLLLAFPSGSLRSTTAQAIVVAAYVAAVALRVPIVMLADDPAAVELATVAQGLAGGGVMVATAIVLVSRLRRAERIHRRVLIPLYSYGIGAVIFIALSGNVFARMLGVPIAIVAVLQLTTIAGLAVAFVLGVLLGSFARTGQLEELGALLGTTDERAGMVAALAQTLGDPSLEVSFWVPARDAFVDADGGLVAPIAAGAERATVEVEVQGRRVAAIRYNPALIDDPETVRAAGRIAAIALERERLTAELRASRRALQNSRERLVDAADRERRRVARDLHDGLQVQLVLLALEAQQIANGEDMAAPVAARTTNLRRGIDAAASELRQLVSAVMPAALVERGLSAATEDLVDRMPIPTTLEIGVGDGDCSDVVESTAYFVIAEALTNAVKHSGADHAWVRVARVDDRLRIEVTDDGEGGASVSGGLGLRSLADRVDVLGGTMSLTSDPGRGTQLTVEVPCES